MATDHAAQDDFDRAACGLALIAPDGRFVRVNATLCAWLGYSQSELQARRFHDVLTIGSKLFHQTHWMPLLQIQRSVAEVQLELVTRDQRVLPMLVNAVLRPGEPRTALIDLAAFVTADRRKYERELLAARQRAEELLLQAGEAQSARETAEASLRADAEQRAMVAEQLMGIVSHDLRNPLHAVLLGTQLLAGSELPSSSQRVVQRITAAAQRATRLVSDILDFTRARLGGGLRVSVQRIDLHALVADCLDEARLAWPGRAIAHEARGEAIGRVDPDRFAQIVSNLINNALSYGEPSKPVTVTSSVSSESVELSVHNAGPPIAEPLRDRIFEPMQRGTDTGPSTRSVGLGLYIVREIVNAHRGSRAALERRSGHAFRRHAAEREPGVNPSRGLESSHALRPLSRQGPMRKLSWCALVMIGAACGGDNGDTMEVPCDPFDRSAPPIALAHVLAVGRDANGVLYALDDTDDEVRAFVSEGELLVRQPVSGQGTGNADGIEYFDISVDVEPPYRLYLELPDEGEPRFLKREGEERPLPGEVVEGEELELLEASALDALDLRNLAPDVTVEYLGALEDGRHVLVTVPSNDFSYENFRAFVGEKDAMVEHTVLSVDRRRDGGSTTIEIELDGASATLDFPVVRDSAGLVMPGPATFREGGETLAIELLPNSPSTFTQHSFVCEGGS